jgi:hypothetical protein
MKNKFISGPAAVLILALFFLPWVMVSCNGQTVGELSGYELAAGIEPGSGNDLLSAEGVEGDASLFLIPLVGVLALVLLGLAVYQPSSAAIGAGGQIGLALLGTGVLLWKWSALQNNQDAFFEITILPALWGTAVAHFLLLAGGSWGLWEYTQAKDDLFDTDDFVPVTPPSLPKAGQFSARAASETAPPRDHMPTWVDGTEDEPVFSDSWRKPDDLFDTPPAREDGKAARPASKETQLDWERDEPAFDTPASSVVPPAPAQEPDAPIVSSSDKTEVLFDPIAGETAPPPAWLVIREGENAGEQFRLLSDTGVGREPDNTITLSDTAVSNYHARIVYKQNQFVYDDLDSTNGSYWYEADIDHWRKIDTVVLEDGMQIKVGRLVLHFMTV